MLWGRDVDNLMRAIFAVVFAVVGLPVVAAFERFGARRDSNISVGPRGGRTALATALKLLQKRAPRVVGTDRLLSSMAPVLALIPTVGALSVLPLSPTDATGATLPLLLALPALATGAVALAGFGAASPLALLSALRLVTLRMATFCVVALCALAPARQALSAVLLDITNHQSTTLAGLPQWGAVTVPTSFLAAVIALAVLSQHSQRLRTAASLQQPWFGDVTGPVLLGHRVFESIDVLVGAAVVSALFLGAWHIPGVHAISAPLGALALSAKTIAVLWSVVFVKNRLPTMSHAAALRFLWLVLAPIAAGGVVVVEVLHAYALG